MIIGVPREIKAHEYRVGMLPVGVEELIKGGHRVIVEAGAGLGSGLLDSDYTDAGAEVTADAAEIWDQAQLIVKVKEPQEPEWSRIRGDQLIFTYFHFAADRALTEAIQRSGATALAYETLQDEEGKLRLLTPMSEVAGRMSIQQGAKYLERPQGGRGILLGGVPGVEAAHITILGGGVVGTNAAKVAAGFGARVTVLDTSVERLRYLDDVLPPNVTTLHSDRHTILQEIQRADLIVGAVLLQGARAPRLIRREDLRLMKPGAVIVDVAVDQGGCVETTRPTTHGQPTFVVDDVVHYCVANMPGAVGRTSTYALCNVTLPYVIRLADHGLDGACRLDPQLVTAVNIHRGRITHPAVAATFNLSYRPFA
ncbi:MAG: alanine dehydrogenase [Myxococcales bacterium]|jgi:alanine dehydrogenase|nr:alanine dehydrogenase [Myxococcales bacterium]